jgi:hypothetical protein
MDSGKTISRSSFSAVIEAFGGPADYAAAIAIPAGHARAMKTRDSISPGYWRRTAAAATQRKISWITFEFLAGIAARDAEKRLRAAS